MSTTLATFMKIAITVVVIMALIWGLLYPHLDSISNRVAKYIDNSSSVPVTPNTIPYNSFK